jgi:hypothetical protein
MSAPHRPKPYGGNGSAPAPSARARAENALNSARSAAAPVADRASRTAQQALHSATEALGRLTASARDARDRRSATRVGHRPDGTPVSPSPAAPGRDGTSHNGQGPLAALKARWALALQEGRLAAREKEADVRASYERRVRHDAHLHAEQHRKPLSPSMQPRVLPPASVNGDKPKK